MFIQAQFKNIWNKKLKDLKFSAQWKYQFSIVTSITHSFASIRGCSPRHPDNHISSILILIRSTDPIILNVFHIISYRERIPDLGEMKWSSKLSRNSSKMSRKVIIRLFLFENPQCSSFYSFLRLPRPHPLDLFFISTQLRIKLLDFLIYRVASSADLGDRKQDTCQAFTGNTWRTQSTLPKEREEQGALPPRISTSWILSGQS